MRTSISEGELRQTIIEFARAASLEVSAGDAALVPELAPHLQPGVVVYVAHTPKAALEDVVRTALAVQAAGFSACPHVVARRIAGREALHAACERLAAAGVDRALVVAGDDGEASGSSPPHSTC